MINRILDQPLSLNPMSLGLLFKSHDTKPSPFIRANGESVDDSELLRFLKNYFEHGLPIFSEDVLDEEFNQVIYHKNPIEWINKFSDSQIELTLSYIYLKKYIEHYFMSVVKNNKVLEDTVQQLINNYSNKSIIDIQLIIHDKILEFETILKGQHPSISFNYQYNKYLKTKDLNDLFVICYNLFFKGVNPSSEENLYNKKKISDLIA